MHYTFSALKAVVIEAAIAKGRSETIASDLDCLAGVTDSKSFAQALRKEFLGHRDSRKLSSWCNMAEWIGTDPQPWKDARTRQESAPKWSDLKAKVLTHYKVTNTKALKKKLKGWKIPFTDLHDKSRVLAPRKFELTTIWKQ